MWHIVYCDLNILVPSVLLQAWQGPVLTILPGNHSSVADILGSNIVSAVNTRECSSYHVMKLKPIGGFERTRYLPEKLFPYLACRG